MVRLACMSGDARQRPSEHGEPLVDAATVRRLRRRILTWYQRHGRDLPWRHTSDPYAILISEVMLQQTQVRRVIPKYATFLDRYPDLESLASAPLTDVLALWSGLGYNNRAVRLRACAQAIAATAPPGQPAQLPRDVHALELLPGLGPYTARAVPGLRPQRRPRRRGRQRAPRAHPRASAVTRHRPGEPATGRRTSAARTVGHASGTTRSWTMGPPCSPGAAPASRL